MTTFNDFWKEMAQKRRKSRAAKAKRFAEQHTQLEDIRKEVYLPLDYGANFSFEDCVTCFSVIPQKRALSVSSGERNEQTGHMTRH